MNSALESVPILVINIHSRCNCRCTMCDIWRNPVAQEFPPALLARQLPDMVELGVKWVVFSGGEPLMHSAVFTMAELLREIGIRVTILTTGLLLAKHAEGVANHIDDVIVSLDGPLEIHDRVRGVTGAFQQIRRGLDRVHQLRPELRATGRCTIQKLNHGAIAGTIQAAKQLGLQSLSFLAADLTSTAFRRAPPWPRGRQDEIALTESEIEVLDGQIERLITERDPLVTDSPEHLRRIARHFRVHLGHAEPCAPLCNAPWVSAVIESDGAVRPCFFHNSIGNLASGPLLKVLNGPAALHFRDSLQIATNSTCRQCVCSINCS